MNSPDPLHAPRTGDQHRIFHQPDGGNHCPRPIGKPKILPANAKAFKRQGPYSVEGVAFFWPKGGNNVKFKEKSLPLAPALAGTAGMRKGQVLEVREEAGRLTLTKSSVDDPVAAAYGILMLKSPRTNSSPNCVSAGSPTDQRSRLLPRLLQAAYHTGSRRPSCGRLWVRFPPSAVIISVADRCT